MRNALSVTLYVFSGLALTVGVLALVLLLSASRNVTDYDAFFQLAGIGQLAPLFLRPLQVGLMDIGIGVLFLMVTISGLLFAAGRLAARQAELAERVRALEEKFE
jgi:hypothetical protein